MDRRAQSAWHEHVLRTPENEVFRDWLTDRGSLTKRLSAAGGFSVALLKQRLETPSLDELGKLHLTPGELAWVREVALLCDGHPLVFAHSVLPRRPRGPLQRWLTRLGNRSLGALLFAHPNFVRGRLSTRKIDPRHPLYWRCVKALGLSENPPDAFWARRSSFAFGRQSVLVTEAFAPAVAEFGSTPSA
jgi:chorismate--pyruvate lyase